MTVGRPAVLWAAVAIAAVASAGLVDPAGAADAGASASSATSKMGTVEAVALGLVEGVTEYIPVSSTGHLTVTQRILGIGTTADTKSAADSYAIAIQAGAILAVLVLYRRRIATVTTGVVRGRPVERRIATALVIACVPAAIIGLALEPVIKERLFGIWPIVAAWLVGGVAILAFERTSIRGHPGTRRLEDMTVRTGLAIGVAQCLALWPGASRSLVTLIAALALGMSVAAAVEFSFLLGLLTLGAATGYETVTNLETMTAAYGIVTPLIGLAVAFVAAVVAVQWMVGYLTSHGLGVFGWYRIGLAATVGSAGALGAI